MSLLSDKTQDNNLNYGFSAIFLSGQISFDINYFRYKGLLNDAATDALCKHITISRKMLLLESLFFETQCFCGTIQIEHLCLTY